MSDDKSTRKSEHVPASIYAGCFECRSIMLRQVAIREDAGAELKACERTGAEPRRDRRVPVMLRSVGTQWVTQQLVLALSR